MKIRKYCLPLLLLFVTGCGLFENKGVEKKTLLNISIGCPIDKTFGQLDSLLRIGVLSKAFDNFDQLESIYYAQPFQGSSKIYYYLFKIQNYHNYTESFSFRASPSYPYYKSKVGKNGLFFQPEVSFYYDIYSWNSKTSKPEQVATDIEPYLSQLLIEKYGQPSKSDTVTYNKNNELHEWNKFEIWEKDNLTINLSTEYRQDLVEPYYLRVEHIISYKVNSNAIDKLPKIVRSNNKF